MQTEEKIKKAIGVVLTNSTTSTIKIQLRKDWERTHSIFEGMLVLIKVKDTNQNLLGRIDVIVPSNDLYKNGNIFSAARKQGVTLPSQFSQSWVSADIQILLNTDSMGSVTIPPSPGDLVYLIEPSEAEELMFKGTKKTTKLNFGYLHGYSPKRDGSSGIPIPMKINNMPMHLGVFGVTGSGKSYNTGALLERLLSINVIGKQGRITYPAIIIDAHGDYLCYFNHAKEKNFKFSEELNFNLANYRHFIFPMIYNKKRELGDNLDRVNRVAVNLDLLQPREIAELIVLFYHGDTGTGEKQITTLTQILKKQKILNPELNYNHLFISEDGIKEIMNFMITRTRDTGDLSEEQYVFTSAPTRSAIERILNKFYEDVQYHHKLISSDSPFKKEEYIDEIIKNGLINIVDFSAAGSGAAEINIKQFIMSYIATILFNRFRKFVIEGKKKYHLLFLIEEAQIYCPSSSYNISASLAKEKIRAIATQGRKFGLALGIITQRPSFVDQIVLSMLNSFIIHRVAAADVSTVSMIAGGLPDSIRYKLTTLRTGNFIFTGQMNFLNFPLWGEVVGFVERKIKPDVGDVNPTEDLHDLQNSLE